MVQVVAGGSHDSQPIGFVWICMDACVVSCLEDGGPSSDLTPVLSGAARSPDGGEVEGRVEENSAEAPRSALLSQLKHVFQHKHPIPSLWMVLYTSTVFLF